MKLRGLPIVLGSAALSRRRIDVPPPRLGPLTIAVAVTVLAIAAWLTFS